MFVVVFFAVKLSIVILLCGCVLSSNHLCKAGAQKVRTYLGAFGCELQKPLLLWGNCRFLQCLQRLKPDMSNCSARERFYTVDWEGRVTGQAELAASAVYTQEFAMAIIRAYQQSLPRMQIEIWPAPEDDDADSSPSIDLDLP